MDVKILKYCRIKENAFIYNIEGLLIFLMKFLLFVSIPIRARIPKHICKSNFYLVVIKKFLIW